MVFLYQHYYLHQRFDANLDSSGRYPPPFISHTGPFLDSSRQMTARQMALLFSSFFALDMHGEVLHGVPFDIPTWSCLSSCHDYFWTGV